MRSDNATEPYDQAACDRHDDEFDFALPGSPVRAAGARRFETVPSCAELL